jgi:hypothetical protein
MALRALPAALTMLTAMAIPAFTPALTMLPTLHFEIIDVLCGVLHNHLLSGGRGEVAETLNVDSSGRVAAALSLPVHAPRRHFVLTMQGGAVYDGPHAVSRLDEP